MTASMIALFWGAWYLIIGQVPAVTSIKLTEDWVYHLPFEISRWWDILIGPIWSVLFILFFTSDYIIDRENEDMPAVLAYALFFCLASGLILSLIFSLIFGLAYALIFCLAYALIFCLAAGPAAIYKNLKPVFNRICNWLLVK